MATSRRLGLATNLAAELRQREGRNLVAVGVYGSVARGGDRRHSDVDVLVVVRRKRAAIHHLVRDGILITILQHTPQEATAEVTAPNADMNDALSGWRSMKPIYDPSGFLRRLIRKARHPADAQWREAARRALIETYEDLGKLRNAIEDGDAAEAREMAIWYSGGAMGALLDLHHHVLRTGRRAFIEIRRYGRVGEAIRQLRYEPLTLSETGRLAERSWTDLLALARRRRVRLPRFAG